MVEKNRSGETFCLAKHLTLPNGAIFIAIFAVIIALLMFLVFKCKTSSVGKYTIILEYCLISAYLHVFLILILLSNYPSFLSQT